MYDELFATIGVILVSFVVIHFIIRMFKLQNNIVEGLVNADTSTPSVNSDMGIGSMASTYAANIKAEIVNIQDELLISKYRDNYESVIVNLDELVGMKMIQHSLNVNINGTTSELIESLGVLNTLQLAKDSLNNTMKYLDNQ